MVWVYREDARALEADHDLVDPLAGSGDQLGDLALGDRQRDEDALARNGIAVALGEVEDLEGDPAAFLERLES